MYNIYNIYKCAHVQGICYYARAVCVNVYGVTAYPKATKMWHHDNNNCIIQYIISICETPSCTRYRPKQSILRVQRRQSIKTIYRNVVTDRPNSSHLYNIYSGRFALITISSHPRVSTTVQRHGMPTYFFNSNYESRFHCD